MSTTQDEAKAGKKQPKAPAPKPATPATIFLPTLLPDPFGEASPELCWEWSERNLRVAVRLTQFGWGASAFEDGVAVSHWSADSLPDLREDVIASVGAELSEVFGPAMLARWALAYEVAGF